MNLRCAPNSFTLFHVWTAFADASREFLLFFRVVKVRHTWTKVRHTWSGPKLGTRGPMSGTLLEVVEVYRLAESLDAWNPILGWPESAISCRLSTQI